MKRIVSVYGGAVLIGLALVSFPASSSYLTAFHGFTDQEYGSIFLPQLVLAILGALTAGAAVKRLTLKSMYMIALATLALSQLLLWLSSYVPPVGALLLIMCGTACFGFGFGFGGGPLNGLASLLFPRKSGSAITALHMMAGVGLMVGPLVVSACIEAGIWIVAPAIFSALSILLLALSSRTYLPNQPASQLSAEQKFPYRETYFWLMMLISFLYALSEAAFSNWAVIFLDNTKGFSVTEAGSGLAAFWGGLTFGRLLVAFIVLKIQPFKVWLIFPALMVGAFFMIPRIDTPFGAIASFAFAGLACSAFFPLMIAVGSNQYPYAISWLASMLTAALMFGVGVGSYAVGALVESFPLERIYYISAIYPAVTLIVILFTRRFEKRVFDRDSP